MGLPRELGKKVCPQANRIKIGRLPYLSGCFLALVVLARPGTAWLQERSVAPDEPVPSFRTASGAELHDEAAFNSAEAATRAAAPDPSRISTKPGFRAQSKPFDPVVTVAQETRGPEEDRVETGVWTALPAAVALDLTAAEPTPPSREREVDAAGALAQLEISYQLALASLSSRGGSANHPGPLNPFEQALDGSMSAGGTLSSTGLEAGGGTPLAGDDSATADGEAPQPPGEPALDAPPSDGGGFDPPPGLSGHESVGRGRTRLPTGRRSVLSWRTRAGFSCLAARPFGDLPTDIAVR